MRKVLWAIVMALGVSLPAVAETSLSVGGTILNSNSVSSNGRFETHREKGKHQEVYEASYLYQKESGEEVEKRFSVSGKNILSLDQKNYGFVMGRYDYDHFNVYQQKLLSGLGWGYKIFRTPTTKMSNELSVGTLTNESGTSAVIRNSLWLRQKLGSNTTFVNKFLIEQGKDTFILNRTSVAYALSNEWEVSVNHIYKRDKFARVMNDNLTTFEIGYKF